MLEAQELRAIDRDSRNRASSTMSPLFTTTRNKVSSWRAVLNLAAGALWHAPGPFRIARMFGPRYTLRCVLFHDVSDTESSFTSGLGSTITRKDFEAALKFLSRNYTPVSLQEVLADSEGQRLPPRPVLVTFDDAYASVSEFAAPLCLTLGVPAVFFVNCVCLDNRQLALDNLICYVANVCGMRIINAAAQAACGTHDVDLGSLAQVFSHFLPALSLQARAVFRNSLVELARISEGDLAAEARLYLSSQQLRELADFNFEIGSHTYTHMNCRFLSVEEFADEIDGNKTLLEATSGTRVRSFSVPYGSSADLTADLVAHLHRSGYEAVFLAEGRANSLRTHRSRLDRISIKAGCDSGLFSEIEVLPRLRTIRNWVLDSTNFGIHGKGPDLSKTRSDTLQCAPNKGASISGGLK